MIDKNGKKFDGVSIIICCYNSAERLPKTIEHIANQVITNINWELIIVDNNSTDETNAVAKNEWNKYGLNNDFNTVFEPNAGLGYARLTGVKSCKYNLILFCDDDNWLQNDYLKRGFDVLANNKNIGILAGQSTAFFETEKPQWFDTYEANYAVGKPLENSGIANDRNYLAGAASFVRREIFDVLNKISFSYILNGRKGNSLASGDDGELCILALFMGYDLYYDDQLQFIHFISKKRLTWSYNLQLMTKGFSISQVYLYLYDYCIVSTKANQLPDFKYAYSRNLRKPAREIITIFKNNPPSTWLHILCSINSTSLPSIQFKKNVSKLLFVIQNKTQLKKDFSKINDTVFNLKKILK